jgi:hypothetical protein
MAALTLCFALKADTSNCYAVAFLADPIGLDIMSTSMTLEYDPARFAFDPLSSGFLCQFSVGGDCPPAAGAVGTFPLPIAPTLPFSVGQPLPGSGVALTDTGTAVTLDYDLASPVTITDDTNFFLFMFRFIDPVLINPSKSTVTYSALSAGDFTQTSFVCHTDSIPDLGCGSAHGITGVTLNLIPEPSTILMVGSGAMGLLASAWRRRKSANSHAKN